MTTTTAEHDQKEMKDCPMCGESILAVAKKCKHCGSDLSKATTDSTEEGKNSEDRKVGFLLGMGIFLFSPIFSWFTLRKGYSHLARSVSFIWMVIILAASLQDNKLVDTENVGSVNSSASTSNNDLKTIVERSAEWEVLITDIQNNECYSEWNGYLQKQPALDARKEHFMKVLQAGAQYAKNMGRESSNLSKQASAIDEANFQYALAAVAPYQECATKAYITRGYQVVDA